MKKILCALLVCVILVSMVACNKAPTKQEPICNSNETNQPTVTTPIEKDKTEPSEETTSVPVEDPTESIPQLLSYDIYVPNENANGFVVETISTEEISEETVLVELKKYNVLTEDVSINSFHVENNLITIDFNQAFADIVCSMGISGEVFERGSNAVRRLFLRILGDCVELASSLEIVVGIGLALGHSLKLVHHNLFYTVSKLCKAARCGLVVGNNELVKCRLVNVCIKIVLNSDVFHKVLLFAWF